VKGWVKIMIKKIIIICILLIVILLFVRPKYKLGMIPENPKMEKIICKQLEKNELTEEDLLNVNRLVVNGKYGRVKTLVGIERLKNLEILSIYPGKMISLEPITKLTKLKSIGIARQNKLTDLQLIGQITTLTDISLRDMPNIDISFLENLRNLNDIYIADCGITNIDCLKNLNPEEVHLWNNILKVFLIYRIGQRLKN